MATFGNRGDVSAAPIPRLANFSHPSRLQLRQGNPLFFLTPKVCQKARTYLLQRQSTTFSTFAKIHLLAISKATSFQIGGQSRYCTPSFLQQRARGIWTSVYPVTTTIRQPRNILMDGTRSTLLEKNTMIWRQLGRTSPTSYTGVERRQEGGTLPVDLLHNIKDIDSFA